MRLESSTGPSSIGQTDGHAFPWIDVVGGQNDHKGDERVASAIALYLPAPSVADPDDVARAAPRTVGAYADLRHFKTRLTQVNFGFGADD